MRNRIEKLLRATPGLKGKDIAKRINAEKKSVNSFLYAHKDAFIQDDDYCWFLAKPEELRIEFSSKSWVDCSLFERALNDSGSPLDLDYKSVVFIVPEECNIMLDAAARFLALCNQLSHKKIFVRIDFSDCKTTLSYFDRIGFLSHLHERITVLPKKPLISRAFIYKGKSKSVVEFGSVNPNEANKELINQLVDYFVQLSSDSYEAAASTVFGELIGNIKEHSKSSLPGFAALQQYAGKRKHIQTVVSDSGLGIAATLKPSIKEHHSDLYKSHQDNDYDLKIVTAVLTQGEISRHGSGRGLGFKSSREQTVKFEARLSVRQENFSLDLEYRNGKRVKLEKQENLSTIRGTHLCFDFYVD